MYHSLGPQMKIAEKAVPGREIRRSFYRLVEEESPASQLL